MKLYRNAMVAALAALTLATGTGVVAHADSSSDVSTVSSKDTGYLGQKVKTNDKSSKKTTAKKATKKMAVKKTSSKKSNKKVTKQSTKKAVKLTASQQKTLKGLATKVNTYGKAVQKEVAAYKATKDSKKKAEIVTQLKKDLASYKSARVNYLKTLAKFEKANQK